MFLVNQHDLQGCGTPENTFGPSCILHTRQLHHDASVTLTLNHRLRHPQFIDPVTQCSNILFQGKFGEVLLFFVAEARQQNPLGTLAVIEHQARQFAAHDTRCVVGLLRVAQNDTEATVGLTFDTPITHLALAQCGAQIGDIALFGAVHCVIHIHFEQKMHTTAQVEAKVHWQSANVSDPGRRCRQQSQCYGITVVKGAFK